MPAEVVEGAGGLLLFSSDWMPYKQKSHTIPDTRIAHCVHIDDKICELQHPFSVVGLHHSRDVLQEREEHDHLQLPGVWAACKDNF